MEIKKFEFNIFGENTYLIWDSTTREAAVIDPGMCDSREFAAFDDFARENKLNLRCVLLTHMHVDHTLGLDHVLANYSPITVYAHSADAPLGEIRGEQAKMFHLHYNLGPAVANQFLNEGDAVTLGSERVEALHAPGHSPGSLLYYVPSSKFILTGDVLFRNSIGRTDLPGGSHRQLLQSIASKIVKLPTDIVVYPGHGPATTVGFEMAHNPFL